MSTAQPLRRFTLLILLFGADAAAQGPVSVHVDPVRREEVQERRMVTGDLRARRRSLVATREPGVVLELGVLEGQRVKQGELLARLDSVRLDLELVVLEAQGEAAEATRVEREREALQKEHDLEVLRSLAERDAANPKELADAEADWNVAVARRAQAERLVEVNDARKRLLAQRIEDTRVRAPFDGVVTARHTEIGAWLGEGDTVVEVVSADLLDAWLEVPQQFLPLLGGDAPNKHVVRFEVDATGVAATSSSYRLVRDVDLRGRSFYMVFEAKGASLAPGMSVTAWIPTGQVGEALTVARDAILRNETGPYVYLALGGGEGELPRATPVSVDVLFYDGDRAVVRSERLSAGQRAIVEGNERLLPLTPVRPLPSDGAEDGR